MRLDGYNAERQAIEAAVLDAALGAAEDQAAAGAPSIVVAGEGWHAGVIGIVAGRLRERFDRPACVVALDGGVGKGSGRSVPGVATRRGGDRRAPGRACWSTAAAMRWRRASRWRADALGDFRAVLDDRVLAECGGALPAP